MIWPHIHDYYNPNVRLNKKVDVCSQVWWGREEMERHTEGDSICIWCNSSGSSSQHSSTHKNVRLRQCCLMIQRKGKKNKHSADLKSASMGQSEDWTSTKHKRIEHVFTDSFHESDHIQHLNTLWIIYHLEQKEKAIQPRLIGKTYLRQQFCEIISCCFLHVSWHFQSEMSSEWW